MKPKRDYDWPLISVVTILLALGVVMVFSASYPRGLEGYGDPLFFVTRQLIWLGIGLVALFVTARVPYWLLDHGALVIMAIAVLGLILVIVFGTERFGSTRAFIQGSIQPSEVAKLATIIYIAKWLTSKGGRIRDARIGLVAFGVLMGFVSVLIVLQPEITTAILIVATAAIMLFIAGADLKQLLVVGLVIVGTFFLVLYYSDYASSRLERYVASVGNPLASDEWQVTQAVQALMRGGVAGQGVGNGLAQQTGYLPVSWSDNIFGVIGEELGLLGTLSVILLFGLLAYRGLRIALQAPDNFSMLVATGITSMLVLQALLNMAVIAATAPPTGVTLPFVSYGGSSLVVSLASVGILLNISRYCGVNLRPAEPGKYGYERVDIGRRNGGTRLPRTGRNPAARAGSYRASIPRSSVGDGRVRRGGRDK
jgi:cell division protein FtsW